MTCLPGSNWHAGLYDASPRRPDCPHGSPAGGKALLQKQTTTVDDAGLRTLHASIFTENCASIAPHHAAGC